MKTIQAQSKVICDFQSEVHNSMLYKNTKVLQSDNRQQRDGNLERNG